LGPPEGIQHDEALARPRELGPWKSVGVEEEHEIAASGAQPLVERARLAGPTRRQRRGSAVGGLSVHDDDLGEVRLGIRARRRERGALPASSREPARQHDRRDEPAGARHHDAALASGA
jgi:hypothetical protein